MWLYSIQNKNMQHWTSILPDDSLIFSHDHLLSYAITDINGCHKWA